MKNKIIGLSLTGLLGLSAMSCSDFLDKTPMSQISPEHYYSSAEQIDAILMDNYNAILPGHGSWYGFFEGDDGTDNQVRMGGCSSVYTTDLWRSTNENGSWDFSRIYYLNFAFSNILPRYGENIDGRDNTISGNLPLVQHYIGELYFLRAYHYFSKLRTFGDFPIILEPLADDWETLSNASVRSPRNEVARQILDDLDKAIYLMQFINLSTNRINRDAALLLKSRVALYEGTWLKYFKGTPFVPGGEGWPGSQQYPNYQFPAGSIEGESKFFLEQAMEAAKEVGDRYVDRLANNTGKMQQSVDDPVNDYYDMFAALDMSVYPEILLWRQYNRNLVRHDVCQNAAKANGSLGLTRMYVQNFLMADGSPVYTHGSYADGDGYYMGDKDLKDVRENRDGRLQVFLKVPGDVNQIYDLDNNTGLLLQYEPIPEITSGTYGENYPTGYAIHKGGNLSRKYYENQWCYTGCPILRASEALLNYMEASYELKNSVDGTAQKYWEALRKRAHVNPDFNYTISLTDMSKEAENDWAAYSGGQLIDPTLYNIRRERRCELLSEGFRYNDLKRWRALDQLITTPCHIEGMHLWNTPMQNWYTNLKYDIGADSNVSSPEKSEYIRPYEKNSTQYGYNGLTWKMGHYLNPISTKQILLSSPDGITPDASKIYQNPYWPNAGSEPASK